uniref:F-box domain-containing protein n=1 Tax=Moniliophthora roreri TaxID=221103 RepID=A0A0W0G1D5_MONRR
MLEKLPAEVILLILSTLSIPSLHSLKLTSKAWNDFLQTNEGTVYHGAAVVHGYIDSTSEGFDRLPYLYSLKVLAGMGENWKTFSENAAGEEGVSIDLRSYQACGPKDAGGVTGYDEAVEFIYFDTMNGLSSSRIPHKEYAHIEYQNGYLIFDRLGGRKEFPRPTRAFRFVYPTLLVGGWDEAYCLDVPTRTLAQTISGTQEPTVPINSSEDDDENIVLEPLGEINYVEVSAKHVFICGSNTLRIFDRQSGACVLDMPSTRRHYGRRVVKVPGNSPAKYLAYDRGKAVVASYLHPEYPSSTMFLSSVVFLACRSAIQEYTSIGTLTQLRTVMWNKRHRDEQEALQYPDTSGMPGSFGDDNDDQDDTVRRQESQFLDAEDTFRKTMQRKGRYGVLPTGDLVVMLDQGGYALERDAEEYSQWYEFCGLGLVYIWKVALDRS